MSKRKKPEHISQEAWDDAEIPELTDEFFKNARPAKEVMPSALLEAIVERRKRGQRGPQKALVKVPVNLRVDPEVLNAYKATGSGYQTRMVEVLRKHVPKPKVMTA